MLNKEDINVLYKVQVILKGYNKHNIAEKYENVLEKVIKGNNLLKNKKKGKVKNETKRQNNK